MPHPSHTTYAPLSVIASNAKQSYLPKDGRLIPDGLAALAMTLCCLLLLCATPAGADEPEQGAPPPVVVNAPSDCDKAAVLDLQVVYDEASLSGLVAPPPGVYMFQPGDGLVLRAYGTGGIPVAISWSGDVSGAGETLYVDMDACKTITVTFSRAAQRLEREAPPWFDVPPDKDFYAFLGGGNLYGWFAVRRDKTKGAGITHLTHKDAFLTPIVHFTSLNFEHVFTGAAADNARASFTPRTDPMRFCVESPGAVRVRWPAQGASWDMECEMVYRFTDDDAIDMEFYTTPGTESFPLGYVGFMWATYHSHFRDHVIHFPGVSEGREGWVKFGPTIAEGHFGGTVTFQQALPLTVESGANTFNITSSESVFFTEPLYYGEVDLSLPASHQQLAPSCIMMFDQERPLRFAVWNWGDPPEISAWDWQYVLHDPQPGQRAGYRARMVCAPFGGPTGALSHYREWRKSLSSDTLSEIDAYPELPLYWSPSNILFDPLVVGECIERYSPDQALALYRTVLLVMPDRTQIAVQMDNLLSREYDNERRVKEWLYIRDSLSHWPDISLPLLHLSKAYHAMGNVTAALEILKQGLAAESDSASTILYYGELLLETGEMVAGLEYLARAVAQDPQLKTPAGKCASDYAAAAWNEGDLVRAEVFYRKAIELTPDDHWHKVHLGELLAQQERDEEAEELYRTVLLAAPESPYTAQQADALYEKRHDVAGHIEFWRNIYGQHPEGVVPALHLGMAYYHSGDYETAEAILDAAPSNTDVRFYLGAARLRSGKLEEGTELIEEAAAGNAMLEERAATVFAAHANAAMASGDFTLAETLYRRAVALVPADVWYSVYLGEAVEKQGRDSEALTLFTKGINRAPELPYIANLINAFFLFRKNNTGRIEAWQEIATNNPDSLLPKIQLVLACYEGGQYEQAIAVADKTAGADRDPEITLYRCASMLYGALVEDGMACLRDLAAREPAYAPRIGEALATRAAVAGEAQDYEMAERMYRCAMTVAPDDLWHKVHLAETLEHLTQDDEALSLYSEVLLAVPDSPYSANRAHEILLRRNNPDECIRFWRGMCERHPDAATLRLHLARACYEAGNLEEVLTLTADADAATPQHTGLVFYRCAAQLRLQDVDAAAACLVSVAAQDGAYAVPAAAALARRGDEAAGDGNMALATRLYRQAVAVSPDDLSHAIRLGEILEAEGALEEAVSLYVRVLVSAQNAPHTAARLDALLARSFDIQRRIATWADVHRQCPEAALPLLYLGKAYEAAQDPASAQEAYRGAQQRDATMDEATAAVERLGAP